MTPTQVRITLTEDELARWNALRNLEYWPPLSMEAATKKINGWAVEPQVALLERIRV